MMMMMMMKNPVVLVICTLLLSSLVVASQSSFSPNECCFQFRADRLPKKNVMSYKYTDNRCPMAGLLFTMSTRNTICVDPKTKWVQVIVNAIDRVKAKAAASATSKRPE
ncbi:monocyte chemotactic protein 1B-like [Betta splendens]|uniref:C-C motif chemokine n=1 Tax=Betta splendens TaxID=158456 RepID=A0A6P7LTR6_BETSP|nr:monocyte chemotactic protein 1B-like [Betta splendens]